MQIIRKTTALGRGLKGESGLKCFLFYVKEGGKITRTIYKEIFKSYWQGAVSILSKPAPSYTFVLVVRLINHPGTHSSTYIENPSSFSPPGDHLLLPEVSLDPRRVDQDFHVLLGLARPLCCSVCHRPPPPVARWVKLRMCCSINLLPGLGAPWPTLSRWRRPRHIRSLPTVQTLLAPNKDKDPSRSHMLKA